MLEDVLMNGKELELLKCSFNDFFDEYGNHDVENWMKKFQKLVPSKRTNFCFNLCPCK